MKYIFAIFISILTVYLLTNLIISIAFKGETIFIANAVLWATVIPLTLFISKLKQVNFLKTDKTIVQIAAILAVFQTFLAVFMAFFMGFGKNTLVWTPSALAIYFPFLLIPFLATEFSRALLAQTITKRKPTLALLTVSLFYTLLTPTIHTYLGLTTPLAITEFLIRTFIPTLAISLLATYFAYLGGFPANLVYMAIPAFFTWFSPILPNIQWQTSSILTVIAAAIGFILLDTAVKPLPKTQRERISIRRAILKKGKSQLPYWTIVALIAVVAVWSSTGLLGFTPTVIASGSMQPTLNVGDMVIVLSTPAKAIKIGDIIQYQTAQEPTVHRVIDKYEAGGTTWFVTQGDANNAPDDPVNERQVMGKVVLTIPKLGWVSIYLKEFAANTYTFITATLPNTIIEGGALIIKNGVYITSALAFTAYSYLLLTYREKRRKEEKK